MSVALPCQCGHAEAIHIMHKYDEGYFSPHLQCMTYNCLCRCYEPIKGIKALMHNAHKPQSFCIEEAKDTD